MSYFEYQIERSVEFFLKFIDDSILDYNIMEDEARLEGMLTEYDNLSNDEKNNISEGRPKDPYEEEFQKLCFMLGDFTVLKNKSLYFHIDEDYASSKQFTGDLDHIAQNAYTIIVWKVEKHYNSSHSENYRSNLYDLLKNIFRMSVTFNIGLSTKQEIDSTSFPRRREMPKDRGGDFTGGSLYEKYAEVYPFIKKVDSNNIIESSLNNMFISISDSLNMGRTYNMFVQMNSFHSWLLFIGAAYGLYLHNLSCLFQCYD
ncbi:uncharacterized protein RJT21DRAFT_122172, partial [Scheffersomyces amazonensis]|uniref:uncharacterized protein n=1 Tax=Scheffersomyces amazonensis TaxID=1078765 RepID=UPI00315D5D15